jgi:DinB family protein
MLLGQDGVRERPVDREQLLKRLDKAWAAFQESYVGLSEAELVVPGVTGAWSIKDIIAHVSWWEEEALKHLPLILAGGRPPRYSVAYGGIDAFNAKMTEQKKDLSLVEVLRHRDDTHRRLVALIHSAPEAQMTRETRFRRRLRLDTYGHYPKHARAIRTWRERRLASPSVGGVPSRLSL